MVIDIILLVVAVYGFYLGFSRGIIKTIFTILSVLFGIMAAAKFGPHMTDLLESVFNSSSPMMFLAGSLLTFVLTMMLIRMMASGLENILQSANINIINQAAGGLVMASLLIAMYSVLLSFGDRSHIINEGEKEASRSYVYLKEFPTQLWDFGKRFQPIFEDFWDHSVDFMDRLERMNNVEQQERDNIFDIEEDNNRRSSSR